MAEDRYDTRVTLGMDDKKALDVVEFGMLAVLEEGVDLSSTIDTHSRRRQLVARIEWPSLSIGERSGQAWTPSFGRILQILTRLYLWWTTQLSMLCGLAPP